MEHNWNLALGILWLVCAVCNAVVWATGGTIHPSTVVTADLLFAVCYFERANRE